MPLRLCLLGPPRLQTESGTRELPLDRPASLGYLLALRGDWVRRAELAELYSPEAEESAAASNLRKLVHRLRNQGWAEGLESDATRLRLAMATDVQVFRAALHQREWAQALQAYQGTLLEGLAFPDLAGVEAWLDLERQDLARGWRTALLEQVKVLEAQAEWQQAQAWLARLLRSDPLDEEAVQASMRALQAAGHTAQALALFERFRHDLAGEIGVEPLEATRALADSLRAPRPGAMPRSPGHNLPAPGSRFVGRQAELVQLAQQLARPDCRWLTLVGLGGMGKTRLALELAGRQLQDFADGVWWAPLAEIGDATLLVPSLAAAVGLAFSGPADPQLQLVNFLRGKQLLLVLDNVEHLGEGVTLLEELLQQAPQLKLLLTSRVALQAPSEWLVDLDGLPCPPAEGDSVPQHFAAVELFISRAERLSIRFAASAATLRDVSELARQVEGMPLALELAATWVRGLSVGEILQRLRQGLDVLQTQGSAVPPRQRSLHSLLDGTWQLLTPTDRATLARLSVFRGGFGLQAAQQVAGADLAGLLRLINQALVRRSDDGRYDLHALVRQFAGSQLSSDERGQVLARFSEHFQGELQALARSVRSGIEPDTVARCRRELPHLLSALEHLAGSGQADRLEASLFSVYVVVEIVGLFKTGVAQIERLADHLHQAGGSHLRVQAALDSVKAYFLVKLGEDDAALQLAASAIERLQHGPASEFLGLAHGVLGICGHFAGRFDEALAAYRRALDVAVALDQRSEQCRILDRMGSVNYQLDRYDDSNALYEEALALAGASGDLPAQATLLNNFAINFESTGRIDEAIAMYRRSLEISNRIGFLRVKSAALTNLGHVHERRGEYPLARDFYEQGLAIKQVLGEPVAIAITLTNLADVAYALGDPGGGHRLNFQALAQTLAANALVYAARALWSFCKHFRHAGQPAQALLLAEFLGQAAQCEQWLREEARAMAESLGPHVDPAERLALQQQAGARDHRALADWLAQQLPAAGTDSGANPGANPGSAPDPGSGP